MNVLYCDICKVRPAEQNSIDVEVASTLGTRIKMIFESVGVKPNWNICPHCRAEALREAALVIEIRKVDITPFHEKNPIATTSVEVSTSKLPEVEPSLNLPEGERLKLALRDTVNDG